MDFFEKYLIALVTFFVIDMIWLGLISRNLYNKEYGSLKRKKPNWLFGVVFYLLYAAAIVYFVLDPNLDEEVSTAVLSGAFLGLVAYGTYNLTALTVVNKWPVKISIIDILWGTLATALTTLFVVNVV